MKKDLDKTYDNGIFIGKFYPMHLGHISAIMTLAYLCRLVYVFIYAEPEKEQELSNQFGRNYSAQLRLNDARKLFSGYKNIQIIKLDIPANTVFPNDHKLIRKMVEKSLGTKATLQMFGSEEKELYVPYAYAKEYYLSSAYMVEDENGELVSLHASQVRNNYDFYKKYLPSIVRESIDSITT